LTYHQDALGRQLLQGILLQPNNPLPKLWSSKNHSEVQLQQPMKKLMRRLVRRLMRSKMQLYQLL
jgi:hypothetical protein